MKLGKSLTSPGLSFLLCKMEIITRPTHRVTMRIESLIVFKMEPGT